MSFIEFISSFLFYVPSVPLCVLLPWSELPMLYWIAVERTGILALLLVLGECIQFFHIEYDVSCSFFVDALCQVEEVPPFSSFLRVFIMNGCWIFCIIWYSRDFFVFKPANMVGYSDWFSNIEPALHPWNKPHEVMVYNSFWYIILFIYCWILCLQVFIRNFCICIYERY